MNGLLIAKYASRNAKITGTVNSSVFIDQFARPMVVFKLASVVTVCERF